MDLRRHQRFPVRLQGKLGGPHREEWVGTVTNLSKEGCLIETNSQVYAGMKVSLRLDVVGETSPILITQAAVRWNRGDKVGVGFITVATPDRQRLDSVIERLIKALPVS